MSGDNIGAAASARQRPRPTTLLRLLPSELDPEILDLLEVDDVLCLADAGLTDSSIGRLAVELRVLIRRRRAIISAARFLDFRDLGSVIAAFVEDDVVISQQVNIHTTERRLRPPRIFNSSSRRADGR